MTIAAAYVRVSTEEQTELSPDSQVKLIREYAKKNGYIVPKEFIFHDDGISGRSTAKRQGFNQMIGTAKLKPKPFDAILLWKFSRFARNREDSIVYKSMLRKLGIDVISISENVGDDKMSVLIEAMIEAMDEYYSINLAEEVKRGMTEKFGRGLKVSGPPLGYDMKNGEFVVNEQGAEIVRRIFDMYVNQDMGYLNIARELNAEGIRTLHGNDFETRTIAYIIRNPVYIGMQRWTPGGGGSKGHYRSAVAENVVITQAHHPAIIDKKIFEKAQQKAAKARRPYERSGSTKHEYMLRGLLKCSSCGSNLTMASVKSGTLQCYQYAHGRCKESHAITIGKIDKAVIEDIQGLVDGTATDYKLVDQSHVKPKKDTSKFETQLERERMKLERVKAAYADGIDTLEEYKHNKSEVLASIAELESKLRQAQPPKPQHTADRLPDLKVRAQEVLKVITSPNATPMEKNNALRTIVDKVVFDRKTSSIEMYYLC